MRRPCSNCPWRVDAPREYWDPAHFELIWRNCQDDGMSGMFCHKSPAAAVGRAKGDTTFGRDEVPAGQEGGLKLLCQGWLRVMGTDSIGVRIALLSGDCSYEEVGDLEGPELFRSFEEMMAANGVKPPARNVVLREGGTMGSHGHLADGDSGRRQKKPG